LQFLHFGFFGIFWQSTKSNPVVPILIYKQVGGDVGVAGVNGGVSGMMGDGGGGGDNPVGGLYKFAIPVDP
jgi:hypothetical protein